MTKKQDRNPVKGIRVQGDIPQSAYDAGLQALRALEASGAKPRRCTARQEAFAQAVVDGANQSDAYRYAYGEDAVTPSQVSTRASYLMRQPQIVQAIMLAKSIRDGSLLRDREKTQRYVIDKLQQIVEIPGNHHSARVHALTMLGKVAGLFGKDEKGGNQPDDRRSLAQIEHELKRVLAVYADETANVINGLGEEADASTPVTSNNLLAENGAIPGEAEEVPHPPVNGIGTP